jgi:ribosome-binding protein aMBF1 (putative translation factor)
MSNRVYDIAKVQVCEDCVIIMTNGDASALSEEEYARWEKGVEREALLSNGWEWSGVQCDDWEAEDAPHDVECAMDGWFSHSWCECCGETYGGQRWNVAIMRRLL